MRERETDRQTDGQGHALLEREQARKREALVCMGRLHTIRWPLAQHTAHFNDCDCNAHYLVVGVSADLKIGKGEWVCQA